MASKSSNNKEYTWTFSDVRALDSRLEKLESRVEGIQIDIKDIKEELAIKNHIVVDNSSKTDWKAIALLIGATIATILAAIQQVTK